VKEKNLQELGRLGRAGLMAGDFHDLKQGQHRFQREHLYAEVDSGERLQKFLRYGPLGCSGAGPDVVGGKAAENR
jgi:hypothetical protein